MSFHPYLFFGGNCAEAFNRYKEIFGGELFMMKMGDAPDQAAGCRPEHRHPRRVDMPDGSTLMASDDPTATAARSRASPSASTTSGSRRDQGGCTTRWPRVAMTQALTETFFSPAFGMCIDRFGDPGDLPAKSSYLI